MVPEAAPATCASLPFGDDQVHIFNGFSMTMRCRSCCRGCVHLLLFGGLGDLKWVFLWELTQFSDDRGLRFTCRGTLMTRRSTVLLTVFPFSSVCCVRWLTHGLPSRVHAESLVLAAVMQLSARRPHTNYTSSRGDILSRCRALVVAVYIRRAGDNLDVLRFIWHSGSQTSSLIWCQGGVVL